MTSVIPEGGGQRFVGFDIETAKPFPEGEDWREHRPLGITCAAIWQGEELQRFTPTCVGTANRGH